MTWIANLLDRNPVTLASGPPEEKEGENNIVFR